MMGINSAFSSWLSGAQSFATTTLRSAQAYQAALQTQTLTAISAAQRAALQPIQQALQPRPSSRSPTPHTTRTITPVDVLARTVQGGVRGAQEAARQISRAHAPIVQGVQRDVSRAVQAAPGAARSAPAAVQSGVRQIVRAHAPIVQGVQRDASRAVRSAPAAVRSAPVAVQQGAAQLSRAHAPIMQGFRRDVGRAGQAIPAPVRSAVSQIARAHAPIAQGIQRDAGRATTAMSFANQRKAAAQAELTRTAGPAATFERGWTHPVYEWGQRVNRDYQAFTDQAYPLWSRTQPLHAIPEIRQFQRGIVRAPGSLLEGLTFIPPAAERGGQLLWKEPHKLPETAAKFAGQQIEGMGAAYERDPYDFAGEMIGTAALSYGIGAAARPGAVARGSSATAPARAAAGSTRSIGGTGRRFRALEFGYRTEVIRKPSTPQKPFNLAEWQKERQKYAGGRAAVQVQEAPLRTQPPTQPRVDLGKGGGARQTSPPPEGNRSRIVYGGVPPLLTGSMPGQVAPADPLILPPVSIPNSLQPGSRRGGSTDQIPRIGGLVSTSAQDIAAREAEMLAMVAGPPILSMSQPMATSMVMPTGTDTRATAAPPGKGAGVPGVPPIVLPPSPPARGKDKKRREEDERRRRRKKGERDHWELGPAPGLREMSMLTFGPPSMGVGGSARTQGSRGAGAILSFGPPSMGAGGVGADPKTPPAKKVAHAAKTKDTARKQTQTGRRTKNSKR
ncbi:MAG: hypothetical protein WC343_11905 [Bacilli bacterium]|jgi:hypothetical protein